MALNARSAREPQTARTRRCRRPFFSLFAATLAAGFVAAVPAAIAAQDSEGPVYQSLDWTAPEQPRGLAALGGGSSARVVVAGKRTLYVLPFAVESTDSRARASVRAGEMRSIAIPVDDGAVLTVVACSDLIGPCGNGNVFVGTNAGTVLEVDVGADEPIVGRWKVEGRVHDLSIVPSGLVSVAADEISLWDSLSGERLWTVEGSNVHPRRAVARLACDRKFEKHRMLVNGGRLVEMWDVEERKKLGRVIMPSGTVAVAMPTGEEAFHVTAADHDVGFVKGAEIFSTDRDQNVRKGVAIFAADPERLIVFHEGIPGGEVRSFPTPGGLREVGAPGVPLAAAATPHAILVVYANGELGAVPTDLFDELPTVRAAAEED